MKEVGDYTGKLELFSYLTVFCNTVCVAWLKPSSTSSYTPYTASPLNPLLTGNMLSMAQCYVA
jgi:hypothetical protein